MRSHSCVTTLNNRNGTSSGIIFGTEVAPSFQKLSAFLRTITYATAKGHDRTRAVIE
ncbi:hypothetical protein [Acaryochloris marina]|uniref:hypothetical protein n=1 Tax=Acaryochloris marina TaxID=155978 RepID=UPI001BB0C3F4|nr:hypothetical protein [Acaryochloris marina]QUY45841.1 hypothetical protein I1H34_29310 [Acaryochloris marina S15]